MASRGPRPARVPGGRRLIEQLPNQLVGGLRIERLLTRQRLALQTFKTMIRIAMPPKADNPWLDPNLLGDRSGAATGRCQQHDPCPLQIALNVTGERQRSSSTLRSFLERLTSLASGIIQMLNYDLLPRESGY